MGLCYASSPVPRSIQVSDVKKLFGLSGAWCAFPSCEHRLVVSNTEEDPAVVIGEMAHIVPYSNDGPRGDHYVPENLRNRYENLILLCPTHHTQVDAQPRSYPPDDLRRWKRIVEARVNSLSKAVPLDPPFVKDPRVRQLGQRLQALLQERDKPGVSREERSRIQSQVLDIRRELRSGPELSGGDVLGESYCLIERIGRGAFGTVWKARDRRDYQPVAVKVLHGQYANDHTMRERFFRGARHMAGLKHPAIVSVLDEGGEDGGYYFFVMDFVSGRDLQAAVLKGEMSKAKKLEIILRVGDALSYAHDNGLIHRDVKPSNILLDEDDHPKLTDFDLVKAEGSTGGTRHSPMGTFGYAAPECLESPADADPRSDVYSLAMCAAFALHGADLSLLVVNQERKFIGNLDVSLAIRRVLKKATSYELPRRYPSVSGFCRALSPKSCAF